MRALEINVNRSFPTFRVSILAPEYVTDLS